MAAIAGMLDFNLFFNWFDCLKPFKAMVTISPLRLIKQKQGRGDAADHSDC